MQSLEALLRDFQKTRANVDSFIKNDVTRIIGVESVRLVKTNFINESYNDGLSITSWPKRKASTNAAYDAGKTRNAKTGKLSKYRTGKNSTYKGSVYSSSKPLLRQTLALYNSITYRVFGSSVFIGTNLNIVPYAAAHNQGLGHEPRRQYMPYGNQQGNPLIMRQVTKKVEFEIYRRMNTFKK
jgi:hypothetical protein